ncbi:MAG: hypothetical protein Q4G63_02955 [Bacteroidia bacterium]|nr:hypothetical protein [Bacteroidia bacterium]
MNTQTRSLEAQRHEFAQRKFLAMPIAGAIMWAITGIGGLFLPSVYATWLLFICTGFIAYLGMFISKFTGENFLDKKKQKNTFDNLFFFAMGEALLVYSIAIPFFMVDYTSLPLTVGILTGLMWLPFSWIIQHWVGLFHGILRTVLVLALWYLLPELRFVAIPFAIVIVYLITILILLKRVR